MKRTLPEGHTVKYVHLRDHVDGSPSERGGSTYAVVKNSDDQVVVVGEAFCRHDEFHNDGTFVYGDQFNKRLGRTISLGRALKALEAGLDDAPRHVYMGQDQIDWIMPALADWTEKNDLRP